MPFVFAVDAEIEVGTLCLVDTILGVREEIEDEVAVDASGEGGAGRGGAVVPEDVDEGGARGGGGKGVEGGGPLGASRWVIKSVRRVVRVREGAEGATA